LTNIPYTEFEGRLEELKKEICIVVSEPGDTREVILDGPINPKVYYSTTPKVLWLMKEPYDTGGGGWDFSEACKDSDFRNGLVFGSARPTWQPVVYIAHCVENDFASYDSIDDLSENRSMLNALDSIAWVNIQKLPSKNVTETDMEDIFVAAEKYENLLLKQLKLFEPDVIICGGTVSVAKQFLGDISKVNENGYDYLVWGKTAVIPAYHPAQRNMSRKDYVDSLVGYVKYWHQRSLEHREVVV
jgi:hypothetical protein